MAAWTNTTSNNPAHNGSTIPTRPKKSAILPTLCASGILNLVATLASTRALQLADASVATPFLSFNPAFTLFVSAFTLQEIPSACGVMGVLLIVLGAYLFQLEEVGKGVLAPVRALARQPGVLLAIGASFVWGLTPIFEKIAIQHTTPENPLLVAFATTLLTVVLLTPALWRSATNPIGQMRQHRGGFVLAGLISGIAPLFGFSAIALGYVGYVTALFKLGAALTVTRQFFVVDLRHLDTAKIPLDSWSLRVYTLLNNSINLLNIGI